MNALELHHVSKTRGSGRRAVEAISDVSLCLRAGELVLVEGPSGSGKTTLLSVAAGLLTADAGEVVLAGRSLKGVSPSGRRAFRSRTVGFVFQRANLLESLTARENLLIAAAVAGLRPEPAGRTADRLLAQLNIGHLAQRRPAELSGGEEHRVALARALVHRPAVLFADEPTGSLDGVSGRAVAEALAEAAASREVAVMVVTHDSRLRKYATRRLWMEDGRLRERKGE
jgi:putative ABC transport system ATP-binding protein